MTSVEQHFYRVLMHHSQAQSRFILAFSGGIDSRVMLHLLSGFIRETGREVLAVHINHGLSPDADLWAERCRQWCQDEDIAFQLHPVSLDKKSKGGLESIARQARYEALQHYVGANDLLLTGQHSHDQLETFLLALKRGSGPKGLSSMGEVSGFGAGKLVRPLLKISRTEIESFAKQHQLDWVEDESNQDLHFDRNFIRHKIAPVLLKRWPELPVAIQRSTELCAEQEALLDELLAQQLDRAQLPDGSLSVPVLLSLSEAVCRRVLRMWLARYDLQMPSRVQLMTLYHQVILAKEDADPRLHLGNSVIRRFSGRLYCLPAVTDVTEWQHKITFNQPVELPDDLGLITLRECDQGSLSREKLAGVSLTIGFNPQGLSACPVGRCGRTRLKKLFQEYKVPVWQRRRMPILMAGEQVVAIAQLFVDRDFTGTGCDLIWKADRI
ncbi:tRNA(Ile)-lysidine synthase [Vibrio aerogenes CECT 7868]|uniref:tRNA(Ile)-lysidine synthase n=1 Tax=Vibrio aerogenes CECT 7868 TaxID=1216006 RepID=A0A1M5WFS7_9VIBR|nr:tRNA lysidine(34) synthetase TilS [Vibrio aerogenes]SHH86287.1 tRNA(Ile)-lysidine synthase [Vibrio aerogenes CECT 7868]